jgi:transcriptional regulator with GAF, ATPase, and Fis domain
MAPPLQETFMLTPSQETFRDSTRALILHALHATGWVIVGPRGAAARLGLKRTSLITKMKKLGISRPVHQKSPGDISENREGKEWCQPALE